MLDRVFSIQNSEFRTITLLPQQANEQRMRLKMCSNPGEGEGGQQPITSDYYEGRSPNDCFSRGVLLYSLLSNLGESGLKKKK